MTAKTDIKKTSAIKEKPVLHNLLFLFVLPVLTGILLALSALPSKTWYLGFVAFIPVLVASGFALKFKNPLPVFALQLTIALFVFYLWVGSWVLKTANPGFLIGLLMVLPFVILVTPFILFKKRGSKYAPVYFITAWLSAEFIQEYFQLGSPFYNLGHNPAVNPQVIQWYEFTGAAGGTLWILTVNFLIFALGKSLPGDRKLWVRKTIVLAATLIIPVIISILIFKSYNEKGESCEVLIIHPCTDNNDVKYRVNIYELMDIYLGVMLPQLTPQTEYVVLPETAITNAGWVTDFNRNLVFQHFNEKTAAYPNLKLITGAITYKAISNVEKIKGYNEMPGIRHSEKYNVWYYTYNTALQIAKNIPVQMRVKEALVPYQEYAPYPRILPRLAPVGIDFQFTPAKNKSQVFTSGNNIKTAAMICYEVVFGNKFRKAVREGAQAFFVMLNEGWYTGSPKVKQQFLQLSAVRAIENRRYVAHSSNMGISALLNQRGEIVARQVNKQPGFIKHEIKTNKNKTVAAALGNYLGIMCCLTIILLPATEYYSEITNK